MSEQPLINDDQIFRDSVELIRNLGETEIKGTILREYLKFKGVSLWDAIAPFLACSIFPLVLGQSNNAGFSFQKRVYDLFHKKGKPYLKLIRDGINECLYKRKLECGVLEKRREGIVSVLTLAFEPRHYREIFVPLDQKREGLDSLDMIIIGSRYRARQEKFAKQGLIFVEDLFHLTSTKEHKKDIRFIREKLKRVERVLSKRIESLYPHRGSLLIDELNNFFVWEFSSLVKQIVVAEEIIDRIKPDIIASGDDCDPRARIYSLMGKKKGIPSLLIQQGLAGANAVEWLFLSVDKAAIFGEYTKRLLLNIGAKGEKLIITGQPRFDRLVKNDRSEARSRVEKTTGIPLGKKIILFTSQPNAPAAFFGEAVRRRAIESVYQLAKGLEDVVLIVKPHPDEKVGFHNLLGSRMRDANIFIVNNKSDTHELIMACDLLVTFHSTTALEAILADKPVLILNFFNNDKIFYVERGAALEACSRVEAISKINQIFSNEKTKEKLKEARTRFVLDHIFNIDGRASERVVNLMHEMVEARK